MRLLILVAILCCIAVLAWNTLRSARSRNMLHASKNADQFSSTEKGASPQPIHNTAERNDQNLNGDRSASDHISKAVQSVDHHIMKNVILRIGHQPVTPFVNFRVIGDFKDLYDQMASLNPNNLDELKSSYRKLAEKYFELITVFRSTDKVNILKDKHKEALAWFVENFFSDEMKNAYFKHPFEIYKHLEKKNAEGRLDLMKFIIIAKAGALLSEKCQDEIMESEFWSLVIRNCFPEYFGVLDGLEDEPMGIQATIAFERLFQIGSTSFIISPERNKLVEAIELADSTLNTLKGEPKQVLASFFTKIVTSYPEARKINFSNESDKRKLDAFYEKYQKSL